MAAAGTDSKYGATSSAIGDHPAVIGRAVKITVAALNQAAVWLGPVRRVCKRVKISVVAAGAGPKHSAATATVRSALVGRPV